MNRDFPRRAYAVVDGDGMPVFASHRQLPIFWSRYQAEKKADEWGMDVVVVTIEEVNDEA